MSERMTAEAIQTALDEGNTRDSVVCELLRARAREEELERENAEAKAEVARLRDSVASLERQIRGSAGGPCRCGQCPECSARSLHKP